MDFKMDIGTIKTTLESYMESETRLCKGLDGQVYARFQSADGVKVASLDSPRFEEHLTQHCLDSWIPTNRQAIKSAITSVKAKRRTQVEPVCVRIGTPSSNSEIYWDLFDGTGRAVKITGNGWNIVEDPKILFPTHQYRGALGEPEKAGSVHDLREMFGLSAHNEALVISFCLACLSGSAPYPVLLIVGPGGSGKTALAGYLRDLLDPSTPKLRNLPKKEEELAISAKDNHLLTYDDVQTIPPWLETAICKLSKGTTFSTCRGGSEQVLFQGARPIILAGSDEMLLNRELVSRAVVVRCDFSTKLASSIGNGYKDLARIRGALLDIVCHGLGRLKDLEVTAPLRDREFEKWIAACDLPHWGLNAFQAAYGANVSNGFMDVLEMDPLLIAFCGYMETVKTFRGTAGQLLQELNAAGCTSKGNRWPQNPRALSGRLRRDAKLLPEIEMEFDIKEGHDRNRLLAARIQILPEAPRAQSGLPRDDSEGPSGLRRKTAAKKSSMKELSLFTEGGG